LKIAYRSYVPRADAEWLIDTANDILESYLSRGFRLTLRALHYLFVSRHGGEYENNPAQYNSLSRVITRAREAGRIAWDAIIDNTRSLNRVQVWDRSADMLQAAAEQFSTDRWARQHNRCEIWTEKDALLGVVGPTCDRYHVPFMAVRGFNSATAMHEGAHRFLTFLEACQQVTVLYLGDHDPAGFAMSKDVEERLGLYTGYAEDLIIKRLALNPDQVEAFNLPRDTRAKKNDKNFATYVREHGTRFAWELDALEPEVLAGLVNDAIEELIDERLWQEATDEDEAERERLRELLSFSTLVGVGEARTTLFSRRSI